MSGTGAVDRLLAQSGRPPRADARRNLERLVAAARSAVAEIGVEVTAHEIARRAGVGIGTFYRRVPSREVLLETVLVDLLGEALDVADRCLADDDPWRGFHEFAVVFVRLRAESCGISDAIGGACGSAVDDVLTGLRDRIRRLVRRAQDAGRIRADLAWQDVAFLLAAVATPDHTLRIQAGDQQWERNLTVVLDGLRSDRPTAPPGSPPA